jgi:hypothetical protein
MGANLYGQSGTVIISYAGSQVLNGGTVTTVGGNTVHTFTANGTLSRAVITVTYLIVGGGGAGNFQNNRGGAGGGGGGVSTGTSNLSFTSGTSYAVTVGAGGTEAGADLNAASGKPSVFNGVTSTGGYCAGYGAGYSYGRGGTPNGKDSGDVDQSGSNGTTSSITGSAYVYGSSGGGGSTTGTTYAGGTGAGSGGASYNSTAPTSPTNYGAGGGGGGYYSGGSTFYYGTSGYAGVVIISYPGNAQFSGGTITTVGGNTIHTFTSDGTLTKL